MRTGTIALHAFAKTAKLIEIGTSRLHLEMSSLA